MFERISFPDMVEGRATTMSTAMNVDFNPLTKTATSFFLRRGLGDCGEYFKSQFDKMGDRQIRAKSECDEGDKDPTNFPLVWPTKP